MGVYRTGRPWAGHGPGLGAPPRSVTHTVTRSEQEDPLRLPYSSASGQSSLHLSELLQNEGVGGRGAAPCVTPSRCPTNDGCWHHPRVFYPADAPICSGLESRSHLSSFPLQSASNTATRLIIKTHKSVHVTPWFRKYLWASYFQ